MEVSIVGENGATRRESEAPSVAIRDMVNKLRAHVIPEGGRGEMKLCSG